MNYDFTTIINRHGKDSLAADGLGSIPGFSPDLPDPTFDIIPMWVADMGFKVVPSITNALAARIQNPLFGYFLPRKEYYDSIIWWQKNRHGVNFLDRKHIGYENGVLGGVVSALHACTVPGDTILLHSPSYIGFTDCIENNGRKIIFSPLKKDAHTIWRMDYDDMDMKIRENHIHVVIFCNPHNPCGRVWERWEIEKTMEICRKYNCIVISDEIWSDIIFPGYTHIPAQSVNDDAKNRTIALYAPGKTFNLTGLPSAYHIIYNEYLHDRMAALGSKSCYNEMNVLSMHALLGAYTEEGSAWVNELCQILTKNAGYVCMYIKTRFPGVEVSMPQGTYMLFIDCTVWCKKRGKTLDELEKAGWRVGVAWMDGRLFQGEFSIRLNIALPFPLIQEAMDRLDRYVFNV